MAKTRIALIPAYQPSDGLINLLEEISSSGFDVVVVNDGSSPEYEDVFIRAADYAMILPHSENKGKGAAIKTGLRYIENRYGSDCTIVTMDADGQHTPIDALKVVKTAEDNPEALVIGSRALDKNVPLRSKFGNTVTRFIFYLATGVSVHDTQTGLRAFSGEMIQTLVEIPGERYEYEMNVLLLLSDMGTDIIEREIKTIYIDGNSSSHFDSVRDSIRIYREILRFKEASAIGILLDITIFSVIFLLSMGIEGSMRMICSNIIAGILSRSMRRDLSRSLPFQSGASKSIERFVAEGAFSLILGTLLIWLMSGMGRINMYLSKILAQIIVFLIIRIFGGCLFRKAVNSGNE